MTGYLDDPATFKLVDQEDEQDEDLLPQAASQVPKVWLSRAVLPLPRPDCPGIAYPKEREVRGSTGSFVTADVETGGSGRRCHNPEAQLQDTLYTIHG